VLNPQHCALAGGSGTQSVYAPFTRMLSISSNELNSPFIPLKSHAVHMSQIMCNPPQLSCYLNERP